MERKWVFIVMRKKNNELLHLFVYEHLVDADNCAAKLREMYPDEEITSQRYIVREDYQ